MSLANGLQMIHAPAGEISRSLGGLVLNEKMVKAGPACGDRSCMVNLQDDRWLIQE